MNFRGISRVILSSALLFGAASFANASLVGFYSFNGNVNDTSGNNNNGVISGTPTFVSGAPFGGQAISFDGVTNSFVTVPINVSVAASPQVTFGAWVNASTLTATSATIRGVISNDDGDFDRTIDVDTRNGGLLWSVFIGGSVKGSTPVTANQWILIAASYDQSTQSYLFDVNGTFVSGTTAFDTNSVTSGLTFGRNPNFDSPFGGQMADAFVFNQALTQAQLDNIQANGPSAILGTTAVPEPASLVLLSAGLIIAGAIRRKRGR